MPGTTATEVVNADIAEAVLGAIEDDPEPLVMLHDYHLYTCPALIREARPDVLLHHFVHIPWSQPDSWRILPGRMREEHLPGPAGQRHHRLPHHAPTAATSSIAAES